MSSSVEDSNKVDTGGGTLLKKSLTQDEYESIPVPVRSKIETALGDHIEDYLTAKALFESTQVATETKFRELKEELDRTILERDELKSKVDGLSAQFEETNNRLTASTSQLNKIRENIIKCEKETEILRKERDQAVDERQIAVNLMGRKNTEIEHLTSDVKVLNDQLSQAIMAKCEALAAADDVAQRQVELELKEKRIENESIVLRQQNVDLRSDLARIAEEMTQTRRESTSEIQSLATKLAIKDDELTAATEHKAQLTQANQELTTRIESLTEALKEQNESEIKLVEHYQKEVRTHQKMVDLHKNMVEVAESKITELGGAVRELQRLLGEATTQYGDLETKMCQADEDHRAELEMKHQAIVSLRKELESANTLLNQVKQESTEEAISRLSPLAASTSKLLKSGLTLTQLYCQYAEVSEELINQKQENQKLTEYVNKILKEIEEKAPILSKQREDYDYAINMVDTLSAKVDDLVKEQSQLRKQTKDSECNVQFLTRENKRYKQSVSDLSRQVCYLLKELEAIRGNFLPVHDSSKTSAEIKTTSDVIEKHLVTFRDLEELQVNNQKLMAALRELSDEKDAEEMRRETKEVTQLKNEIKLLNSKMADLEEREQVVLKQVDIVKGQRDVYQRLLMQHAKPGSLTFGSEEMSGLEDNSTNNETPQKSNSTPQKSKSEPQQPTDEGSKLALEELKKTFESYRAERATNERMLNETIERLQKEKSDIALERAKLGSQAEYSSEKCKTFASTVKSLRAQVQSLEQKCSSYLQTTTRLEESHRQLRQEAMSAMTKLSVAEVTASNLKQENQFLKDSEKRLLNERNNDRKTRVAQEMLMANLETLKSQFECSNSEGRRRLEDRLDDATKELSSLRRKLEEEQEKFNKKVELLEEQTKTSKDRLEEEKKLKEKALGELQEAREALTAAEQRMDDAANRLGTAISTSKPVIERDNKIKDLEKKISDYETDIKNLEEKLQHSKRSCDEMKEMCEVTEKQLVEITEKYEQLKKESDDTICELKKTEMELRNSITQLEIRVSTSRAAEAEIAAQREGELASLRAKVTSLMEEVNSQREATLRLETELKEASQAIRVETERCTTELQAKAALQQEIDKMVEEVKIAKLAAEKAVEEKAGIEEARKLEVDALNQRLNELGSRAKDGETKVQEVAHLNELLHEQIDRLTEQIGCTPSPVPLEDQQEAVGENLNKESKVLMDILQHVRKEKTSALAMATSLKQEKLHLEAEIEVMKIQIEELQKSLNSERTNADTPTITVQKHAQLLHQVEVLSQLTESNKNLSEERDRLMARLGDLEASARKVEEEIVSPVKLRASELSSRLEVLEVENQILKAESQRWRTRSEELIEKCNQTNPEDLKRLTLEKENLNKQLSTEREQFKSAKIKLEQQVDTLEKEKSQAMGESAGLGATLNGIRHQLDQVKSQLKETIDKSVISEKKADMLSAQLEDSKAKEMQIRQIAKKYKTQFLELSKEKEAQERKAREAVGPSTSQPQSENNEANSETVKMLNQQLMSVRNDLETVRKENEMLQNNSLEKEDRAKNLLKNARNRVVQLTEEKNALMKELNETRTRPKVSGDAESRISALESRISRLEKEKSDEQSEKERLGSEVEMLTQKLLILQRQLDKHQGSKPTTSCAEKGTNEPPTANIKPMAGTSSSTTKQHQHSATVTPWRETTPFASIRPLSQPTRTTVVVLPTSQTTSPSNQPVMVAPQQSVHTSSNIESPSPSSSHMDYMPVTSTHSGANSGTPAGVARPERREEDTAPPTQTQNVNVALVLPQPLQPGRAQVAAQSASAVQEQQQAEAIENTVSASVQEPSEQSVSASQPPVLPIYCRQVEDGQGVASSQEVAGGSGTSQLSGGNSGQPSSSSSSVSTSQGNQSMKRPHPPSSPSPCDHEAKLPPQVKRSRVSGGNEEEMVLHSDVLEVEYQVPTSSQRDQDDPLVISDDEIPDQGAIEDGGEFEEDTEEEGRYGMETYSHNEQELTSFDDAEGPDIDEGSNTDQDNNEVDIIDDSNEVPNQCESSGVLPLDPSGSTEATSSGAVMQQAYQPRRAGPSAFLQFSYDEAGDESVVPSTPTLYVPRRVDGFGEPVSSPHVPSPRFTFGSEPPPQPSQQRQSMGGGVAQVASEGIDDTRMDLSQLDEGRRVPTTPSHVSPQDGSSGSSTSSSSGSGEIGQSIGASEDDLQPPQPAESQPNQPKQDIEMSTSSTDGVTSEGEKTRSGLEGVEEEGREAEAGPSAPRGSPRASSQAAKRSVRVTARRAPPQPIVWEKLNVSTSGSTPTTQTVTMLPFRGVARGRGMGRGGAPPGEAAPGQPGQSPRPPAPFVRGNRARRSARTPFHFNNQNRF